MRRGKQGTSSAPVCALGHLPRARGRLTRIPQSAELTAELGSSRAARALGFPDAGRAKCGGARRIERGMEQSCESGERWKYCFFEKRMQPIGADAVYIDRSDRVRRGRPVAPEGKAGTERRFPTQSSGGDAQCAASRHLAGADAPGMPGQRSLRAAFAVKMREALQAERRGID